MLASAREILRPWGLRMTSTAERVLSKNYRGVQLGCAVNRPWLTQIW